MRVARLLEQLRQDIRFTLRQLSKSPAFSAVVVATFAIGIAANAAIFSVMDALVLHPLAVPDLARVVTLAELAGGPRAQAPSGGGQDVSFADFDAYRSQNHTLAELAARAADTLTLTSNGQSESIRVNRATLNLFELYRIQPELGRTFAQGEDQPGRDAEVVLTHAFWLTHFSANPNILNQPISLDGRVYTVVGIMPQSFDHITYTDLWLPLALTPAQQADHTLHQLYLTGRLRPGATVASASSDLNAIAARLAVQFPVTNQGLGVQLRPLLASINGDYTPFYTRTVLFATLLLMLIVCANISNLQFSRTMRRAPEMAMRCALGSSRARILRQLLVESMVLSLFGVASGLILAQVGLHFTVVSMPTEVSRYLAGWNQIGLNPRTLVYSIAVALAAGLVSGLAPALLGTRVNLVDQLKSGSRAVSGSARSHGLRNLFAAGQITVAAALVTGAALIAASMYSVVHATTRFAPQQSLVLDAHLPAARYPTPLRQSQFYAQALTRLQALPGVESADLTTGLPYGNNGLWWQEFSIAGEPARPGESRSAQRLSVSPDFLPHLGVRVLAGRALQSSDTADATPVALISQRTARQYFGPRNPLGQKLQMGKGNDASPPLTIVGVVDDVIYTWVDQVPQPAVYVAAAQFPPPAATFVLRTGTDPLAATQPARQAIAALDPAVPVNGVQTYAAFLHQSLIGLTYAVVMLVEEAGIALLLCALGIFGVMANLVTERTHEIGIRFALGADRAAVIRLMLRRSLAVTAAGLTLGILLSLEVKHILASVLQGIQSVNAYIALASIGAVALISLLAGYVPARRAATVSPTHALRAE